MKSIVALSGFLFFTLSGNILLKRGAGGIPELTFSAETFSAVFSSWAVLLGLVSYGLAAAFWFVSLSLVPLNIATTVSVSSYVFLLLISFFFFNEPIPMERWMAMGMIVAGMLWVGKTL